MPQVSLNNHQVEEAVEQLDLKSKIRLVQRLEEETWNARWDKLLSDIDRRLKKHPISDVEIAKEVEIVRRKLYGKSRI